MERGGKYLILALVGGFVLYAGVGFTMRATDSPPFCGNCHVMWEAVRTHQKSVHAKLACNECHAPTTSLIHKMFFKTKSGMKDIFINTLGNPDSVILAGDSSKEVINSNCQECHRMSTLNVKMDVKKNCVECHRQVPHSKSEPIAQRRAANE